MAGTTETCTQERTMWIHLPSFEKGPDAIGTFLWHEVVKLKTSGLPGAELVWYLSFTDFRSECASFDCAM